MILAAARDLNLDLARSVFIGDQPSDSAAARAAGISEARILEIGPDDPLQFVRNAFGANSA
jgi:D-glycero-D-manno-heptose 1,7-bisphosphate phosphatase